MSNAVNLALIFSFGSISLAAGFADTPSAIAILVTKSLQEPDPPEAKQTPRLDSNGYPLPAGAINRIGANHFRLGGGASRIVYAPDGKALASTSWDGYLHLWDAATGKLDWRLTMSKRGAQPELAFSRDGKKLAVLSNFEYSVVSTATGKNLVRHDWPGANKDERARCLAIAPDLGTLARGCFDGTVRLHDAATGQETVRLSVGDKAQDQFPLAIEFSGDGKTIYVLASQKLASQKDGVLAFDTKTGKAAQTLETANAMGYQCSLVLSHHHHVLAALGPDRVILWDLKAGKQRQLIEKESAPLRCGAFSPDSRLFAVGGMGADIVLFDIATGKEQQRLQCPAGTISLAFAPDGKTLAAADNGGCIKLWALPSGKLMPSSPEPAGLKHVRFAGDGKQILLFGDSVGWWDVTSAKPVRRLPRDPNWYRAPSVSPDGKLLAAPLYNGALVILDAATGGHGRTLTGHKAPVEHAVFSPDGSKLISAARYDPRVLIWEVGTGKLLHELQGHTRNVDVLAASPDGRLLASGETSANAANGYEIRMWEVASGKLLHRLAPRRNPALDNAAFSMVFSADSSRLVSVSEGYVNSGEVQLWDVVTGKEVRAFTIPKVRVLCLATSADGRMVATGNSDKTVSLWEVAGGAERSSFTGHESAIFSLDFARNGRLLAAASEDAPVYIWNAYATQKPILLGAQLAPEDREPLWQRLADADASAAFEAVCDLIARPSEAPAILEDGWQRLPRAKPERMRKWVQDLGSDQFAVRKTASAELARFAAEHEDLLRQALKQASSLEARQRLEKVLGRVDAHSLRRSRMLEILEQLRTAPARRLLQVLAGQSEDTAMAREAAAGLKRLELPR